MPPSGDEQYVRQIRLPEVGIQGQEKLGKARVLIAGAGGLGSITSLYLTAAGIGHITLVDHDRVEPSNLNRQLLHSRDSLGQPKVISGSRAMGRLNPGVRVTPMLKKITDKSIDPMLQDIDVMVDGSDSFQTRQVLNRAAIRHSLPWVFGGVAGFDGMVSCFVPGTTPCFECVVSEPGRPDPEPGVIGPAAGIVASIQAMETIKLILGQGRPLAGRLLRISGLDMRISTIGLELNPDCPACSPGKLKGGKR